jgi:2-methylcitrate dehydratase PrpD
MSTSVKLTEIIANFVRHTSANALPALAYEKAMANIVDTVGCILAGANSELREPVEAFLKQGGSSGSNIVAGTSLRTSPALAAFANGSFGHALDFDDTLSMMPAHPSAVVVPALLSMLGPRTTGRQFVDAYIIGIEVGAKLGLGIANGHYRRGFHATGTLAVFSGVAALGRLLALDDTTLRHAFGIATSMASGVRCNFGTMTKPLHAGWASHNAVSAVQLACAGITANQDAFEAKAGFFDAYGTDQSSLERTGNTLGMPFVVADPGLALKKYPCIYLLHRPIDALLRMRATLDISPENIDFIECRGAPGAFLPLITKLPSSGLEAKFSMDYVLAVGALDGRYDLAAFEDEAVRRPILAKLYARMRRVEDPRCLGGDTEPQTRSAGSLGFVEVTVRLLDGRQQTLRIDTPPGSPQRPLSWTDLNEKFVDCARHAGLDESRIPKLFDAWRELPDEPRVQPLVDLLIQE